MTHQHQTWTRRKFVATSISAGAAFLSHPLTSMATGEPGPKVKSLAAKTIGIDTHNHMDVTFTREEFNAETYPLAAELKASGLTAICMTFCVDRPKLEKEGEAYERFITSLSEMDDILKTNNLTRALTYSDIKNAKKERKQIIIQSVEGSHFVEGKAERIQTAYDRGVRHVGLMHDAQSSPPTGDIYTESPQYGGLTQSGIDIIKECNRLGLVIDLAHCSNDAITKALETSSKPMLISHTGLNTQLGTNAGLAKMMMPRLISKEQAKRFAGAGGVIGVWTHLADTPLEYAKNIRALAEVAGTEHVCLGTDTKMAPPGNSNNHFERKTNQSWENEKEGFFFTVIDALLQTGFTDSEIMQIGGGNYFRIFDQATSMS